jgi:hypothetical protein
MRVKIPAVLLAITSLCWFGLPSTAVAQSAITGLVVDASGGVLPGVTVEATSPALIERFRTAVTDDQGRYAIVDLRPGAYRLTFTLAGFTTLVRDGIDLPSNFTAAVNAQLRVGALEETVTVSGAAPVVDVQNAQRTTVLKRELLDALPLVRTFQGAASNVVGLKVSEQNVGGARSAIQQRLTAHGSLSRDTTIDVDGMKMNTFIGGGDGQPDHNDAMTQEVTVQTSANPAEVSTGGPHINLIPREGGNRFSGVSYVGYSGGSFQSNNLTPELTQRGLQTPDSVDLIYDVNVSLGGPIKRDLLWFFGSYRNVVGNNVIANSFYPDGRPGIYDQRVNNYTMRLTWQATARNKITAYDDYQTKFVGHEFSSGTDVLTASWRRDPILKYTAAVKWTSPATDKVLLEAGVGASVDSFGRKYQPGIQKAPGTPEWHATASRVDIVRSTMTTAGSPFTTSSNFRYMASSSVSYVTGSHAFKSGVQWSFGETRSSADSNAHLTQRYRDGIPDSVIVYNHPVYAVSGLDADLGMYVQDSWTIRRLTLNPGIRFEYFTSAIQGIAVEPGRFVGFREFPTQSNVPEWFTVAPRFGAVYDLTGDAKTAIKGGVNKYVRGYSTDFAARYHPLAAQNDTRNWFDCDLTAGTSTCSGRVLATNRDNIAQNNEIGPSNNQRFGAAPARRPDRDIKRPYDIEYTLGIDRQLFPRFAVAVAWFRKETYNQEKQLNLLVDGSDYLPFQTPSPLNGELITIYNLSRTKQGLVDLLDTTSTDHSKNRVTYNGYEVSFSAQLPSANVLGGWSSDRTIRVSCDGFDPNTFRFCDQSQLDIPFTHDFKVAGNYRLPFSWEVGATFKSYAGAPLTINWAVPVNVFPGGRTQAVTVALIPPGTKYLDRWNQLDVSIRRVFRVGRLQLDANLDIYNALNSNVVMQENQNFGSSLGQPQQVLQGRLLRISTQMKF